MNGNINLPFFGAILPENRPEVNNALERKTRSFASLSIDLIIAENRPAINHVFNRCYKFLNGAQFQNIFSEFSFLLQRNRIPAIILVCNYRQAVGCHILLNEPRPYLLIRFRA